MRTPNTECALCKKQLYRRPFEFQKCRYFACMKCRSKAQSVFGITPAQEVGLSKGSQKGTNHRTGYNHRQSSKEKTSASHKKFWKEHPEKLAARGLQIRGDKHYRWKGGSSRLNVAVRQMTENRRWMDAVKERDARCIQCPSLKDLEAHHKLGLAQMLIDLNIKTVEDARDNASVLWDLENGITLCRKCHYKHHGRIYYED